MILGAVIKIRVSKIQIQNLYHKADHGSMKTDKPKNGLEYSKTFLVWEDVSEYIFAKT